MLFKIVWSIVYGISVGVVCIFSFNILLLAFAFFKSKLDIVNTEPATYMYFRWNTRHLKIWISPQFEKNDYLVDCLITAMEEWNKKSNIDLSITKSCQDANLKIYDLYGQKNPAMLGVTQTGDVDKVNLWKTFNIIINSYSVNEKSQFSGIATIEHELGHAMGLNHRAGKSVMNTYSHNRRISKYDVQALNNILPKD